VRVFDAAVQKAYGGKRKISWFEVFAGEESFKKSTTGLPDDTVDGVPRISRRHQGPAHTPVGGGILSLNGRVAPDARPLRLPAPRAMVHRRPFAREAS